MATGRGLARAASTTRVTSGALPRVANGLRTLVLWTFWQLDSVTTKGGGYKFYTIIGRSEDLPYHFFIMMGLPHFFILLMLI